jgi:predicted RNA binding protein YcfA (HicA-like mRNA interferase family)
VRLPRDLSGEDLAARLTRLDYRVTRQTGSHLRLTTERDGEHHITIPRHPSLRVGTLSAIISDLAQHHRLDRDELLKVILF